MSESQLVTACLWLLKSRGICAWRQNAGMMRWRNRDGREGMMRLGPKGLADIGGILSDGRYLGVECKRPGNRLTTEQQHFLKEVNARGAVGLVVWSTAQLERELRRRDGWDA